MTNSDVERAAEGLRQVLTALISDADVSCLSIEARAKGVGSFHNKCLKTKPDGTPKYEDPAAEIMDALAARVITYLPEAVDRVCDIVRREFDVVHEIDKGAQTRERGLFGYASRHFEVRLDAHRRRLVEHRKFGDEIFEIQVRTAVQHAWAEFEHDLRYKGEIPAEWRAEVDRRFLLAAALIEMADNEFTQIDRLFRDLARVGLAPESVELSDNLVVTAETPLDGPTLTAYLSRRYPDAPRSKADHYEWMVTVLGRLGLTSVEAMDDAVRNVSSDQVATAMEHHLPAGQIRRLDDDLLLALGDAFVHASLLGAVDATNRRDLLRHREERLRRSGLL